MARTLGDRGHGLVHNGPSPQTSHSARCCGTGVHVLALTRGDTAPSRVELVRCGACGRSSWRLDGLDVGKAAALGALSAAFARAQPARTVPPVRERRQPATVSPAPQLSDLLAGWQVLGSP